MQLRAASANASARGCLLSPLGYSMTSSARARSVGGTSSPRTFAVFRLITSSYRVGCCTGKSLGFVPRRIRSTYAAALRHDQAKAETRIEHDRIARVETEANERLSRAWAEIEDRFIRLKADLAQAELRAERAEQLLVLIRREIEDNLMPRSRPCTSGSPEAN